MQLPSLSLFLSQGEDASKFRGYVGLQDEYICAVPNLLNLTRANNDIIRTEVESAIAMNTCDFSRRST